MFSSHSSANAQARRFEIPCSLQLWNASFDSIKTQIGVVEQTGRNDGPEIDGYLRSVGLGKGYPYCYAGQYWGFYVASSAGVCRGGKLDVPLLRVGLASAGFYNGCRKGTQTVAIPQPKDLIFWKFAKTASGHVERIDSVKRAGWVTTIGFNTSAGTTGDQRDGGGVHPRLRNYKFPLGRMQVLGFLGRKS